MRELRSRCLRGSGRDMRFAAAAQSTAFKGCSTREHVESSGQLVHCGWARESNGGPANVKLVFVANVDGVTAFRRAGTAAKVPETVRRAEAG